LLFYSNNNIPLLICFDYAQEQLKKTTNTNEELQVFSAKTIEWEELMKRKDEDVLQLVKDKEQTETDMANLRNQLTRREEEIERMKQMLDNADRKQIDQQEYLLQFVKKKETELEAALTEKEEMKEQLKQRETELDAALTEKEEMKEQFKQRETELEAALTEKEEMKEQLKQQETELKKLKANYSALKEGMKLVQKQRLAEDNTKEYDESKAREEHLLKEIQELQTKLEDITQRHENQQQNSMNMVQKKDEELTVALQRLHEAESKFQNISSKVNVHLSLHAINSHIFIAGA
jgi:chromosome segregation ATPase